MADGQHPIDAILRITEDAFREVTDERAATVQRRLSVPVVVTTGPRGGRVVQRSKPGEPPRLETGRLQKSITAETVASGDGVLSEVSSDTPYAPFLDPNMRRIIFTGAVEEDERKLLDRIATDISKLNGAT